MDMGLVSAGHFFIIVLGFIFFTVVARGLSLEDFGRYALFISLLLFLSKLTDFGTNPLFVAKSISKSTSEGNSNLIDTFYSIKVILFLVTIPISLVSPSLHRLPEEAH